MKEFTAIYSTEAIKNIQYSFSAESDEAAIRFSESKFASIDGITIIENTPDGGANFGRVMFRNGKIVR